VSRPSCAWSLWRQSSPGRDPLHEAPGPDRVRIDAGQPAQRRAALAGAADRIAREELGAPFAHRDREVARRLGDQPVRVDEAEVAVAGHREGVAGVGVGVDEDRGGRVEGRLARGGEAERGRHDALRARPAQRVPGLVDEAGQPARLLGAGGEPGRCRHRPGARQRGAQHLELARERQPEVTERRAEPLEQQRAARLVVAQQPDVAATGRRPQAGDLVCRTLARERELEHGRLAVGRGRGGHEGIRAAEQRRPHRDSPLALERGHRGVEPAQPVLAGRTERRRLAADRGGHVVRAEAHGRPTVPAAGTRNREVA